MSHNDKLVDELKVRFPGFRSVRNPPRLLTVNTIGTGMKGQRNFDSATGLYIKSLVFEVLFVPIFYIAAYVVRDRAEEGWEFFGQVPLSQFARAWNATILAASLACVAFVVFSIETDEDRARHQLAEAHQAVDEGQPWRAAKTYVSLAATPPVEEEAIHAFNDLLTAAMTERDLRLAATILRTGASGPLGSSIISEEKAMELAAFAAAKIQSQASLALNLIDALELYVPRRIESQKIALVQKAYQASPLEVDLAGRMALYLESIGQFDECYKVLEPVASKIDQTSEASRVYGQLLTRRGELEKAHDFLLIYVNKHLKALHRAENSFDRAAQRVIDDLNSGDAVPPSWLDSANEGEQQEIIFTYLREKSKTDPALIAARKAIDEAQKVVPVAMDLALIHLDRARRASDAQTKENELKDAESLFTSIQGQVGDQLDFRLAFAQTRYWLGKENEGKAILDEIVESEPSAQVLLAVANIMRELGISSQGKAVAIEAYKVANAQEEKYEAAAIVAVYSSDIEEKLKWYQRADPKSPEILAELENTRGILAARKGQIPIAVKHLKRSIRHYERMPPSPSRLNNTALIHQLIFSLNGDINELKSYHEGVIEAQRRNRSAILLGNVTAVRLEQAAHQTIGKRINFSKLRMSPKIGHLAFLHTNKKSRQDLYKELVQKPAFVAARSHADSYLIVSPKTPFVYSTQLSISFLIEDNESFARVERALSSNKIDFSEFEEVVADMKARPLDDAYRAELSTRRTQAQATVKRCLSANAATRAIAAAKVVVAEEAAFSAGIPVHAHDTVRIAEKAFADSPSFGSRNILADALTLRALDRLGKDQAPTRELITRYRRELSQAQLLTWLLAPEQTPQIRTFVAKDPDVRRIAQLKAEGFKADSSYRVSPLTWAVVRVSHSRVAHRMATLFQKDDLKQRQQAMIRAIQPISMSSLLLGVWFEQMLGHDKKAQQLLAEAREKGLTL